MRHWRLAAVLVELAASGATAPDADYDFRSYDVARKTLYQAQSQKCAFCETPTRLDAQPTEHFRPKGGAWLFHGASDKENALHWAKDRYWWLAWTWQNLVFSCTSCNSPANKGNHFAINGAPLAAREFDLALERGLIIDPTREDPLDHVRWTPRNPADAREQWEWEIHGIDARGAYTIATLGLKKWDLQLLVSGVIRRNLLNLVRDIEDDLAVGNVASATARWASLLATQLIETAEYAGAKWSALDYIRQLPGSPLAILPFPRPGRHDPMVPVSGLPPAQPPFNDQDWWRLLSGLERDELVLSLCATPRTRAELKSLISAPNSRFPASALGKVLADLIGAGRLHQLADRRYQA